MVEPAMPVLPAVLLPAVLLPAVLLPPVELPLVPLPVLVAWSSPPQAAAVVPAERTNTKVKLKFRIGLLLLSWWFRSSAVPALAPEPHSTHT
jgi:hypothetical protein